MKHKEAGMQKLATQKQTLKTPYKGILPPLKSSELEALTADIKANGVQHAVVIDEDGNILDGHHRYAIDPNAPTRVVIGLSDEEKAAYTIRVNLARRNLSSEQTREIAKQQKYIATNLREADPKKWTQKAVGALLGVSQQAVAVWFTNNTSDCNASKTPTPDARVKLNAAAKEAIAVRVKAGENQQQVSADFGVCQQTVSSIVKKADEAEERRQQMQAASTKSTAERHESDRPLWSLLNVDVIDGLESVRDEHGPARLIFADPPYNIGIDYGSGKDGDLLPDEQYMKWVGEWMSLCWDCLSDDGSFWVMIGDEYAAEYCVALKSVGFTVRNWIKWYETFGVNCSNKFNRTSRHIFYCVKDSSAFCFNPEPVKRPSDRQTKYGDNRAVAGGKIWDDVWQIPRLTGTCSERIADFPTQLPLALVEPIVLCASMPGDLVVDPFNGSGTTGVASVRNGRKYVGIEKSETFIGFSSMRLGAI